MTVTEHPLIPIDPRDYPSKLSGFMSPERVVPYRASKRREGEKLVEEGFTLHVGQNGVWWAVAQDRSRFVQSYERIGYHSCAEELLVGFLSREGTCFFHGFEGIEGQVILKTQDPEEK